MMASTSSLAEFALSQYDKALHRYLMRRLSDVQGAKDLAQETYLRLASIDQASLVRAPQAYLFRIASNLVYELKLREHRDPVQFDSRIVDFAAERVGDPNTLEPCERLIEQEKIEAMLAQLPPLHAAILVMRKRDGKSVQEIAQELGYSVHSVKKYLFKALALCREQMNLSK